MYEKIVVPLDGSKLAEVALPYAEELAAKIGSEIVLLSVLESTEESEYQKHQIYTDKVVKVTKLHAKKYLEESGEKIIDVGTATRIGNPAEGIVEYVIKGQDSLNCKLIVMATHGRSGIGRWAVGSVADKLVRATIKQPMMLIRAKGIRPDIRQKRILKKALVPLDGSTRSEGVIPYICEIASRLEMELTFLQIVSDANHTYSDAEAYLQSVCNKLEDEGIPAKYRVGVGAAADKIIDFADELAIDLVAMSTRGRNSANLWPLGGVAQKVLLAGNTPLMLVKG
ncbi:universal stress protein [Chloroflexota bacterium]